MRPKFRVVVKFRDVVDLILGLDIPVLGATDIDADPIFRHGLKIYAAVIQGFSCAIDGNRTGPGADADFFFLLVLERVEVAHAGKLGAHIPDFHALDSSDAVEQILSEFGQ